MADEVEKKRPKKLSKDLASKPGKVIITVEGGKAGAREYSPDDLPDKIQDLLPAFAVGHKLGDSAAGRSGVDAEAAIQKTWDGMMKGEWTVRVPAAPKISVTEIAANMAKLSPAEQKTAKALLKGLGITIPGME